MPISTRRSPARIASKYRNTGQTCVCANRLLVQASIYDAFVGKLAAAVDETHASATDSPGRTDQGPLIDAKALAKVEEHIADARREGRARSPAAASATRSAARSSSRRS